MAHEVVLEILDSFYETESDPDYHNLKNFTLVSRSWSTYSQRLLFRKVKLVTRSELKSFKHALSQRGYKGPFLRESVESLSVFVDGDRRNPFAISKEDFAELLNLLPNLTTLELRMNDITEFDDQELEDLRTGAAHPRTLTVTMNRPSKALPQLLGVWEDVTKLNVNGVASLGSLEGGTILHSPAASSISVLHWNVSAGFNGVSDPESKPEADILSWLLSSSTSTMKELHVKTLNESIAQPIGQCTKLEQVHAGSCSSPNTLDALPLSVTSLSLPCNSRVKDFSSILSRHPNMLHITWRSW